MGIFGNVITCWVILRNPMMQTATNYYLFNLALSDLLLLVLGLPFELSVFWQQYPWVLGLGLCKIRAYVSEMSSYVSVLTIVAFSMERYLAICHPLQLYTLSGLKRPLRFICASWLLSMIAALPFANYTTINYVEYPPGSGQNSEESAFCAMLAPNMPNFPLYELSCLIFFVIPLILIMVLYIRMGLRIQSNALEMNIQGTIHGDRRQEQSRKAIIRMLTAVVITFFICWAPFHAQRLLYVYDSTREFSGISEWLYFLGGCLYYISTAINPVLYNVMSTRYRCAFMETLCCTPVVNHFNREDQSSIRDTMIYRCGSFKSSQINRNRNRSTRSHSEVLKTDQSKRLSGNELFINHNTLNNGRGSQDSRKLSLKIYSTNNQMGYQINEAKALTDETNI
ncbi:neuropeptides capa receptor-like [Chelonus insularis]|uniref:neuropeptides capa receptor-like n=1 Tax=Chelonus insularis TaxID=460826 RepID=UPI00158B2CCD|nr:neuropeptides capa receptor-like [Chelonus insularis]